VFFLLKKRFLVSGKFFEELVKLRIKQKFRLQHFMSILQFKLFKNKYVGSYKICYFGRYKKTLRNKDVCFLEGTISPSNINTPISYNSFAVLLKNGVCGVKLNILNKHIKNDIF